MESMIFIAAVLTGLGGSGDAATVGAVEGKLMYPSCSNIPDDLRVCGENADTGEQVCTRPFAKPDGLAYRLELPPGRYHVFAVTETVRPGYRAYYSAFVPCGLKVECADHSPLAVTLGAGQVIARVDPADWFAPAKATAPTALAAY